MLCKASQGIYKEDKINNIYGHRFVEGNLSETRCIETCWVCLWLFFVLNRFEDVESRNIHRSFVGWTGTELSLVQLSSSPRLRPLGRRPRESRLRWNAAALGGSLRPRRGCRAFALQRRRGRRQEQRWPGASKWWEAGRRNRVSDLGHLNKFWEKLSAFSSNVWQSCDSPHQKNDKN